MAQEIQISTRQTSQRIQLVQTITIVWMTVEACVSLLAAWTARSPALLAFGGDSLIELFPATVVMWRFTTRVARKVQNAQLHEQQGYCSFFLGHL